MKTWLKHNRWAKKMRHFPVWKIDRHAIAKGVAAGLLVCFLPIPGQTVLAALLVCFIRGNLPAAILATWVSNPITFLPINLLIYAIGAKVLHVKASLPKTLPDLSWGHLYPWFSSLSKAYLVGLPILSLSVACLAYVVIYFFWGYIVLWKKAFKHLML